MRPTVLCTYSDVSVVIREQQSAWAKARGVPILQLAYLYLLTAILDKTTGQDKAHIIGKFHFYVILTHHLLIYLTSAYGASTK